MSEQLLDKINFPEDLRRLSKNQLKGVCDELREFIIDAVSCNPGHFGASLGTVELSVALHYVLNTPYDRIVWDVGHQAYAHKILTGRREVFHTNRKLNGISGFPKREESEYDTFGVGHSSTSISAALGMAIASKKNNEIRQVVAVIGDGALTGGMAYEALNNATINPNNIIIILNDNNMAISANVGGMSQYLLDISTSKSYNRFRGDVAAFLQRIRLLNDERKGMVTTITNTVKATLGHNVNIFEGFNMRYFGPVDGHNVDQLVEVLNDLKHIQGPKVLHVRTMKGKGFALAEQNQTEWHAPGKFDKKTGKKLDTESDADSPPRFQDVFGETLLELARNNDKILGITPAMSTGCSLDIMMKAMPDRAFDVGIAEQHAVTFSAGLATEGFVPFCNIYSTFLQRAYDQVIHDVALQHLNVVLCIDRGGLVGEDGPTHHGVFDIPSLRCIPNVIVSSPIDEVELRNLMYTAQLKDAGFWAIRYPRGKGKNSLWRMPFEPIAVGTGVNIREGNDVAVLTLGPVGLTAKLAADKAETEGVSAAVYNMRFVKPLDETLLHTVFKKFKKVITIEDGAIVGGMGSAILEFVADYNYQCKIVRIGVPDKFIEHGTPQQLHHICGFDKEGILKAIKSI